MYDKKTEANEFVGDSVDEAKANAARFYGVEVEDLKIAVAREGEVSGLNGRTALVAFPKNVVPGSKPGDDGGGRGGRGDRGSRGERAGRGRERERGRGRDRDGDRGRDRGRRAEAEPGPALQAARQPSDEEAVESTGTVVGELSEIGQFVLGVIERMGLGNFEIEEKIEEDSDLTVCQLRGAAATALGSGGVRTAEALQLLANQAAKQAQDSGRVVLDVEGNVDERESSLTTLAGKAADRAADSGRSVALDPMNPRDRRIVHVALRDTDRIATMSIGDGRYRQVLVVPEGASEYEEAQSAEG